MEKRKIMFVDDEPNVTAALKRAFRHEPYELFSADSAKEAMDILARTGIDVVVSDEQMPGVSGSEFLALVRNKYPGTIRMILTGQASLEAAIRAINEGQVYRFFTKPCNEVDLKVTIRQALWQTDLASHSRRLLRQYQEQVTVLQELERRSPGSTCVETDATDVYVIETDEGDVGELLAQIEKEIDGRVPSAP